MIGDRINAGEAYTGARSCESTADDTEATRLAALVLDGKAMGPAEIDVRAGFKVSVMERTPGGAVGRWVDGRAYAVAMHNAQQQTDAAVAVAHHGSMPVETYCANVLDRTISYLQKRDRGARGLSIGERHLLEDAIATVRRLVREQPENMPPSVKERYSRPEAPMLTMGDAQRRLHGR